MDAYLIFVIFGTILERYVQMYKCVTGELGNELQRSSAPIFTKRKKIWASMAICWGGKYLDLNLKNLFNCFFSFQILQKFLTKETFHTRQPQSFQYAGQHFRFFASHNYHSKGNGSEIDFFRLCYLGRMLQVLIQPPFKKNKFLATRNFQQ